MKKLILLIACLALSFCVVGCEKDQKDETTATSASTTGEEYAVQRPSPTYDNWQDFLAAWNESVQNEESPTLTIPVLKSTDYRFYMVEVSEHQYEFYYVPVDYEKDYFSDREGIIVTLEKDPRTFAAVMEQVNLTPVNGIAYSESRNTWYLDKGGRCLDITFPRFLPVTTEEELYNYFDFQDYAPSGY